MSDIRKPDYIVTCRRGRRTDTKFEIFRKSQWTGKPTDEKLYRIRIDGVWQGGTHGDMLFYDAAGALRLLKVLVTKGGDL